MNDHFALGDVVFEHPQRVAAQRLEILLDLNVDVRPRQRATQRVAIHAELVGDAGEEQFDALIRHRLVRSRRLTTRPCNNRSRSVA